MEFLPKYRRVIFGAFRGRRDGIERLTHVLRKFFSPRKIHRELIHRIKIIELKTKGTPYPLFRENLRDESMDDDTSKRPHVHSSRERLLVTKKQRLPRCNFVRKAFLNLLDNAINPNHATSLCW